MASLNYNQFLSSPGITKYNTVNTGMDGLTFGNPSNSNGLVLGASTNVAPAPSLTQSSAYLSNAPATTGYNDAQKKADAAYLSQINTNYDRIVSNGQNSLSSLENDTNSAIDQANLGLQGVSDAVSSKKTQAEQAKDKNIDSAAQAAQNTVRNNRNTLRALGILNSTAAGDMLTRPMTEFDKVKASYVQDYQNRVNELDTILLQETSKNKAAIDSLRGQYMTLKNNIMNDMRFNERERADALNAASAAVASRISQIQTAQTAASNRIKELRSNYDSVIANVAGQSALTNPDFNVANYMKNAGIQFDNAFNPTTAGIAQDEQKKKTMDLLSLPGLQVINP